MQVDLPWLVVMVMIAKSFFPFLSFALAGIAWAGSGVIAGASEPKPEANYYHFSQSKTPNEAIERGINRETRPYYENFSTNRSFWNFYFGIGSRKGAYPEKELRNDIERFDLIYHDLLNQQTTSDPILRTPDLATPFDRSLRQSAVSNAGDRVNFGSGGFEFVMPRNP